MPTVFSNCSYAVLKFGKGLVRRSLRALIFFHRNFYVEMSF